MRKDTVYKHDYLDTWWSVFFDFLPLLEGISYFHNNMCMKVNKLQTHQVLQKQGGLKVLNCQRGGHS